MEYDQMKEEVTGDASEQSFEAKAGNCIEAETAHSEEEKEAEMHKRRETAMRAAEAMRQLLEGPGPESLPSASWNRLGLSVASQLSRDLRSSMLRVPSDFAHAVTEAEAEHDADPELAPPVRKESSYADKGLDAFKHVSFLKAHKDTFIAYKWMLQALLRRSSGAAGGCHVLVADVILFSDGEPLTWIYTNKFGNIDSRKFVERGEDSMWPRYLKTARRAAGVSNGDLESSVCMLFTSTVEGVMGERLNLSELQGFIKKDAVSRHQVVGLQIIVGPKFCYRKRPSRKSILYKTAYQRESSLGYTFKHTKEYDVQDPGKTSAGDMNSPCFSQRMDSNIEAAHPCTEAGDLNPKDEDWMSNTKIIASIGEEDPPETQATQSQEPKWVAPWDAKRQVVKSLASNRGQLSEMTLRCVKYIEKSRMIVLQNLCGHYVEDNSNRVWMVGVSQIKPYEQGHTEILGNNVACTKPVDREANRISNSILRLQKAADACFEAIKDPPSLRKEKAHQIVFAELRGNHFLDQLSTVWQYEIAKTVESKFVECGLEVYYNGDMLEEFYVIMRGSVRLILEPQNTINCRTVDLSDKDTFGEEAITNPGAKMTSRAVALEDTHLMVIKRSSIEAVINKGKTLEQTRWHITRQQLDRCRRILTWLPGERNVLDVKNVMDSTVNCRFFQNIPSTLHMELCKKATFKTVPSGEHFFANLPADSFAFYALILCGKLTWTYKDPRLGEVVQEIGDSEYLLAVGTAKNTCNREVHAIIIPKELWDRSVSSDDVSNDGHERTVHYSKESNSTAFFLTELDESSLNGLESSSNAVDPVSSISSVRSRWGKAGAIVKTTSFLQVRQEQRAEQNALSEAGTAHLRSSVTHSRSQVAVSQVQEDPRKEDSQEVGEDWLGVPFAEMSREEQLALQKERHLTCGVTGVRFPAVLQKTLQRRQVQETAMHLKKRRASSKGYDREKWLVEPKSRLALFDTVIVGPEAHGVYIRERNLQDQEKIFAEILLDQTVPKLSERRLPPSGSEEMITRLLFSGMFVEFVKVESPSALAEFGRALEVRFRLCEQDIRAGFKMPAEDIPLGGQPLHIDLFRMSYFFTSDEGVNLYLKKLAMMEFGIYNCDTKTLVATTRVDVSDLSNKVALQQSFRVPLSPAHTDLASVLALEYVYLHINIGCVKFRDVEAKSFHLRRRQGLYIPSTPFITECLPPDGWDPCNEDYIRKLASKSILVKDTAAITMDGSLIPRSKQIEHLIRSEAPSEFESAKTYSSTSVSGRKYLQLADGIAPAPIWQRKNYGDLPPKLKDIENARRSRPPRPVSAPLDSKFSRSIKMGTGHVRPSSALASSPAGARKSSQRLSSSPAKRSSRPSSSQSNRSASPSVRTEDIAGQASRRGKQRPANSPAKRPDSAPPRAHATELEQSPSAAGRQGRPLSAFTTSRQRPNSAIGTKTLRVPRPRSAMSNLYSSADEGDVIDTIDELEQTEWDQLIRPLDERNLNEEIYGLTRSASSSSSVLSAHFSLYAPDRPASALAGVGYEEEETFEANARVLAAITRPRSAAGNQNAKCVRGMNRRMPSFKSACSMSKLVDLAGKRGVKGIDISEIVESSHKTWRANITPISMLDDDLKALDTRNRLIAFRERTAVRN